MLELSLHFLLPFSSFLQGPQVPRSSPVPPIEELLDEELLDEELVEEVLDVEEEEEEEEVLEVDGPG